MPGSPAIFWKIQLTRIEGGYKGALNYFTCIFFSSLHRALQQSMNELLQNWFCFVQTLNGKIPAVYHPPSEPDHAISLKKAVAAAFQANFEGTDEEDEIDPQSHHKSHYRLVPKFFCFLGR